MDAFADWWMVVKMRIKTMPLKQWDVGRELRKRIKRALDEHGIDMPSPAPHVVHMKQVEPNSK